MQFAAQQPLYRFQGEPPVGNAPPTRIGSPARTISQCADMIAWAAGDGATVALRFLLYVDLLLLAGLTLCGGRTAPVSARRRTLIALAAFGLLLTIMQFAASCLAMVGGDAASLDREMVRFIAFETGMGLASLSRIGLLALTLLAVSTGSVALVSPALAVGALATFAWSGHAGAAEGMSGLAHRIADIIHLLAAAIWIGTLSLLITSVRAPMVPRTALVATLRRFALVGTVVVGLLVVTGLINLWAIAGLDVGSLLALEYGRVLLVKLALFGAMLAFAALNRWRYTPALLGALPPRRSGEASVSNYRREWRCSPLSRCWGRCRPTDRVAVRTDSRPGPTG